MRWLSNATRSPAVRFSTPAPTASTVPEPSWPGSPGGGRGGRGGEVPHALAHGGPRAGALVAEDHRRGEVERLRRGRPLVEFAVGAAQRGGGHLEQHLPRAGDGLSPVLADLDAALGCVLDDGLHRVLLIDRWGFRAAQTRPAKRRNRSGEPTWPPLSRTRQPGAGWESV